MRVVALDRVSEDQWAEIIGAEVEPWGGGAGERMSWQDKDWYLAARSADGELAALAGAVVVSIAVEHAGSFDVLGIGGVFVRASKRGHGLASLVMEALLARSEQDPSGPGRAMLFCRPPLVGLYRKLGFHEIEAPVWADQPGARMEVPMRAMWRPLSAAASWPPGRVDVRGLPF